MSGLVQTISFEVNTIEKLRQAAQAGRLLIEREDRERNLPLAWVMLQALCELTLDHLDAGIHDIPQAGFDAETILGRVQQLVPVKAQPADAGQRVRKWAQTLEQDWSTRFAPALADTAAREGFAYIPSLVTDSTRGGRGNKTLYRLSVDQPPVQDHLPGEASATALQPDEILYELRPFQVVAVRGWISGEKLLLVAQGWRRWVFATALIAPFLALIPTLIFIFAAPKVLISSGLLTSLIVINLVLWSIAWLFLPLYRAVNRGAAVLGDVASIFFRTLDSPLLVWQKVRTRDGRYSRSLTVRRYVGQCPICRSAFHDEPDYPCQVYVENDRSWWPRRLIGRCSNNPVEHVYSFDHITRQGKQLKT